MIRSLALLALALGGCASVPKLAPSPAQGERPDVVVQAPEGVAMQALPNAWKGSPDAVAEHFTPVWIHLVNRGEQAYDITFVNLTLIDEQGRLYAAVPPGEVVRATLGASEPLDTGVRLASAGTGDVDAPLLAQFGFGFGVGPAYDPMDPFNPYGAGPYGTGTASYADAARNIVSHGLREGRLLPKTQAMGFVYFQRAYEAKELHLRVEATPEVVGVAPLVLQAVFTVRH
jgi:hypothetical protein